MSSSILDLQHDAILKAIREATAGQWRVLILDEDSQRLIGSVVKDDEILGERITHIERIERRRAAAPDTDAVYLLTPEAHIVDCVVAEVECRKYRGALLLWTALLPEALRERIAKLRTATNQNCKSRVLDIGIYARESHLITFKDPWSFPILFHPACNDLVKRHVTDLAQRVYLPILKLRWCIEQLLMIWTSTDSCSMRAFRRIPYHSVLRPDECYS